MELLRSLASSVGDWLGLSAEEDHAKTEDHTKTE
jgi:hypothetical protein